MKRARALDTVLWHLQEEGTATVEELARLSGWNIRAMRSVVGRAIERELAQSNTPRTNPSIYGLTRAGIEQALKLDRANVAFASDPPAAPLATTAAPAEPPVPDELPTTWPPGVQRPVIPSFGDMPASVGFKVSGDPLTYSVIPGDERTTDDTQLVIDAEELTCALNSKGELALDVGDMVIRLNPAKAYELRRFLANTTFLDELHQKGLL